MNASDVKTFFEAAAAEWDTMRLTYYDETVIETIADAIAIDDTQTVLDVGTGTGFVTAGLAPRANRVIAIDHSPAMLDIARENLTQLGIENVELHEGDLTHLPLNENSVDAAVANLVLHHAENPAGMLAEMTRVVRPGGRVAITDAIEHPYDGCAPNKPTYGSASPPSRSRASSARPDWPNTGTRPSDPNETSNPRPRSRSPRSESSPPGAKSRADPPRRSHIGCAITRVRSRPPGASSTAHLIPSLG
jgi:ArsR family transcriptional regulator